MKFSDLTEDRCACIKRILNKLSIWISL